MAHRWVLLHVVAGVLAGGLACAPPSEVIQVQDLQGNASLSIGPGSSPELAVINIAFPLPAPSDDDSCPALGIYATATIDGYALELSPGGGYASFYVMGIPGVSTGCRDVASFQGEVPLASLASSVIFIDDFSDHLELQIDVEDLDEPGAEVLVMSPPVHPLLVGDTTPAADPVPVVIGQGFASYESDSIDLDLVPRMDKVFVIDADGEVIDPARDDRGDAQPWNDPYLMEHPLGHSVFGSVQNVVEPGPARLLFIGLELTRETPAVSSCRGDPCSLGSVRVVSRFADVVFEEGCGESCPAPNDDECKGNDIFNDELAAEEGTLCGAYVSCGGDNPANHWTYVVRCDADGACHCSVDDEPAGGFTPAVPLCEHDASWLHSMVEMGSCGVEADPS